MIENLAGYLTEQLTEHLHVAPEVAQAMAEQAARRAASSRGEHAGDEAATLLALCRATAHFAWIQHWWRTDDGRARARHLPDLGGPSEAWVALNELASSPAPDALDLSWPASKAFRAVDLPEGARAGDRFLVGGWAGWRCIMRVEEQGGTLGAVEHRLLDEPLASFYWQANADIRRHTTATD